MPLSVTGRTSAAEYGKLNPTAQGGLLILRFCDLFLGGPWADAFAEAVALPKATPRVLWSLGTC